VRAPRITASPGIGARRREGCARSLLLLAGLAALAAAGCFGVDNVVVVIFDGGNPPDGLGGTGGATATGGASAGSGGRSGGGGSSGSGGIVGTGGIVSGGSGGTSSAGSGGDGSGGRAGSGGAFGSGGQVGSGGSGSGGRLAGSGGASGTGGRVAGSGGASGTGGRVGTGGASLGSGGAGSGGRAGTGGASGTGPCAGLCANPVPYQLRTVSGELGTGATCHEGIGTIQGLSCGNFVPPRTFTVNGQEFPCAASVTPPAPRNGGYCFQTTAGDEAWAFFYTY
jgi:hypothetical protein